MYLDRGEDTRIHDAIHQQQADRLTHAVHRDRPSVVGGFALHVDSFAKAADPPEAVVRLYVDANLEARGGWGKAAVDIDTIAMLPVEVQLLQRRQLTSGPPTGATFTQTAATVIGVQEAIQRHFCLQLCMCHQPEI